MISVLFFIGALKGYVSNASLFPYSSIVSVSLDSLIRNKRVGISAPVQIFIQIQVILADGRCLPLHEANARIALLNRHKLPLFQVTFHDHLLVMFDVI
jgi:hypothetical protein